MMVTTSTGRFTCEHCGRSYVWREDLAGRKARCVCGQFIITPATLPTAEDDLYAMAEEPANKPVEKPAAASFKAGEGAAAPVAARSLRPRTLEYKHPDTAGTTPVDQYFPDRVKDLYLPLGLILFGTVVELAYALLFDRDISATPVGAMRWIGLNMIVSTAILTATLLIVGRIRQIDFGKPSTAMLKICGVVMGTGGIVFAVGPLIGGILGIIPIFGALMAWLLIVLLPFACYYTFLGALFDLDAADSRYCVLVLVVVSVVMYLTLPAIN